MRVWQWVADGAAGAAVTANAITADATKAGEAIPLPDKASIAVLPLDSLSDSRDYELGSESLFLNFQRTFVERFGLVAAVADFSKYTFQETADFSSFVFPGNAVFRNATFKEQAAFDGAGFKGDAVFDQATFEDYARFNGATFAGQGATFSNATFAGQMAAFGGATFAGGAMFNGVTFAGDLGLFDGATFEDPARFNGATFKGHAVFRGVTFTGHTEFNEATFAGHADFLETVFGGFTAFVDATFEHYSDFRAIESKSMFQLSDATFLEVPEFIQAHFAEAPRLDDCRIKPRRLWPITLASVKEHIKGKPSLAARWRALKRLAIQGHDHAREQAFFKGELKARRWSEDKPWHAVFWFGIFYQVLSDFGRSPWRPLLWWGVSVLYFAGLHLGRHPVLAKESVSGIGWAFQ